MIKAPKSLRSINSFIEVCIPTPRDVFNRFGSANPGNGFSQESTDIGEPIRPSGSMINQMIVGQTAMNNYKSEL